MKLIEKLDDQTQEDIRTISDILSQSSYECYMVGGCVRDLLLDRSVKDIDITTNAEPQVVQKLFKRTVPTGIQHGTITVLFGKRPYEVTTYRAEGTYSDARRPDTITFAKTLSEDLSRRDFTINALAYDPTADVLRDEHGGLDDLERKVIRTIGKAHDRFFEDGLRTVRACRFASVLDFTIEEETFRAICDPVIHARTAKVAVERFSDELRKGLSGPFPARLIELLEDTGLMNLFIPYRAPRPQIQKLSALSNMENRLGCYVHFICMRETDPMASIELIAKQLKLSNESMAHAIRTHRFLLADAGDLSNIEEQIRQRKFCAWLKKTCADPLSILSESHELAIIHSPLQTLIPVWKEMIQNDPLVAKDLALNGNDIQELGFSGKEIGTAQASAIEYLYRWPGRNTREDLTQFLLGKRSSSS